MPVYTYIAGRDYVNPHPTELVGLSLPFPKKMIKDVFGEGAGKRMEAC